MAACSQITHAGAHAQPQPLNLTPVTAARSAA